MLSAAYVKKMSDLTLLNPIRSRPLDGFFGFNLAAFYWYPQALILM